MLSKEQVKLCKLNNTPVGYQSIVGKSDIKPVSIESDVFEICGTSVVKVSGVRGGVDLNNLFLILS